MGHAMRVLVLGASGFIGQRLMAHLSQCEGWQVQGASRHPASAGPTGPQTLWQLRSDAGNHSHHSQQQQQIQYLHLDILDAKTLAQALARCDAVVNAVAGSERAIASGARVLAMAARRVAADTGTAPDLVHLSSMAVYEGLEGPVDEQMALRPARAWYARAKQASESALSELAREGWRLTVLRPGCVWGPGSELWVGRIAHWLHSGRLGDLGEDADGWTHGVHVDDVCQAVRESLRHPGSAGETRCLNLAAPDSPRWNDWFMDLGRATGVPFARRIPRWQLRLDAWGAAPGLALAQRLLPGLAFWPPMPPGLLALWRSQLRMHACAAQESLAIQWTPYPASLAQGAGWWLARQATRAARARNSGLPIT